MKLTILGNGSASPLLGRNPSSAVVDIGNEYLLIDCGEGVQYRFLEYKLKFSRLKYILITHLHGDHYFGLIGLISTLNQWGRTEPITLIGPKGLDEIMALQMKYSGTSLNFYIDYIITNPETAEEIFQNHKIRINTFPLQHRIPCTGFVIAEQTAKRKILAEKLPSNFPPAYFKLLQNGEDVTDELSGKIYPNHEYTIEPEPAKTLAYASDTIYDQSIVQYIKNSDLLYHEATFINELEDRARETFHSTAAQAANIAAQAQVKKLVIGHFSSRYKTLETFESEAKAVFPDTFLAEEGISFEI